MGSFGNEGSHVIHGLDQIHLNPFNTDMPRFDLGQIQHLIDQTRQWFPALLISVTYAL